jgi:hypothetical protein
LDGQTERRRRCNETRRTSGKIVLLKTILPDAMSRRKREDPRIGKEKDGNEFGWKKRRASTRVEMHEKSRPTGVPIAERRGTSVGRQVR